RETQAARRALVRQQRRVQRVAGSSPRLSAHAERQIEPRAVELPAKAHLARRRNRRAQDLAQRAPIALEQADLGAAAVVGADVEVVERLVVVEADEPGRLLVIARRDLDGGLEAAAERLDPARDEALTMQRLQ